MFAAVHESAYWHKADILALQPHMSAFGGKADIDPAPQNVRY